MANKTIKDNRKSSLIQWLVFLSRLIVGGTFGSRDLEQLWNDFCDKNNLERDCIDYIELV